MYGDTRDFLQRLVSVRRYHFRAAPETGRYKTSIREFVNLLMYARGTQNGLQMSMPSKMAAE